MPPGAESAGDFDEFQRFIHADTMVDPDPEREVPTEGLAARLRSIEAKLAAMDRTLLRQEFNIQETRRDLKSLQSAIGGLSTELSRQAAIDALKKDGHGMTP